MQSNILSILGRLNILPILAGCGSDPVVIDSSRFNQQPVTAIVINGPDVVTVPPGDTLDTGQQVSKLNLQGSSHWPFRELMGTARWEMISNATVGALMDLGYPAAWYGSGSFY